MADVEDIPMTPDGGIVWRRYRERGGWFYCADNTDDAAITKMRRLLSLGSRELVSDQGIASRIFRFGDIAFKEFLPFAAEQPTLSGRFENLRMNVAVSHALRERPVVGDTRWRMRGIAYHGAIIPDRPDTRTVWAMEYVDSVTLDDVRKRHRELVKDLTWHALMDTLDVALDTSAINQAFHDYNGGNYLISRSMLELAQQDGASELEIVRIDVGSVE